MEKLIDITSGLIVPFLDLLLHDKATNKNIIWATDTYDELGEGFADTDQIQKIRLLQHIDVIKPRIQKSLEAQQARTRKKAEVFTPSWLCNTMNNHCDTEWFGRGDVFNVEAQNHLWNAAKEPITFPPQKRRKIPLWQRYVDSRRLEITCGEAPYLVSRYDVSTGELIYPLQRRIGQLDRKLRVVNENADTYELWSKWAIRAVESCYGYEYQGDNLLVARINLLLTFIEYHRERWQQNPAEDTLKKVINRIVWNIWQMDGLKDIVPFGKLGEQYQPISLFEMNLEQTDDEPEAVFCKIYDWRRDNSMFFYKLKEKKAMGKKIFDFVIGNPPYQNELTGDSNTATPVYNNFMDAVYNISDKTLLITPARFLFNAGYTPKDWNEKMLNDKHLKVEAYYSNSADVFTNVDIKGGVAITYRDQQKDFGAIQVFSPYNEVNSILKKVLKHKGFSSLTDIIVTSFAYHFTKILYEENPNLDGRASKGHKHDIQSNAFSVFPELFFNTKPDDDEYIRILGREGNSRCWKYIKRKYVTDVSNLDAYKAFYAKATGTGKFGEVLPEAIIGNPGDGGTVTFLSIGKFSSIKNAENCVKYTKTKFARALLSVLKVTQDNTPKKWQYVPMQNFTDTSDIDWSKSIHEIDLQLYKKYGLDEGEIKFVEEHVKEMA